METEARKACLERDYVKGISILSDLFLATHDSTYIFNQARCYEQNERYREAISCFREYLRSPDHQDSALAEKHIAECEALEAQRRQSSPASTPPPVGPPVLPTPVPVPQPQALVAAPLSAPDASSSGDGYRTWGIVAAGVGAAGILTGVLLNLKANSLAKSIEPPKTYNASTESTRKGYETASWVGYGLGATGIVTGAVLYGIGWSKAPVEDRVVLIPSMGPRYAGATVKGAF